ncbi:MAG: methyltransferase domain-containing protein [Bacteroidota bacterium]
MSYTNTGAWTIADKDTPEHCFDFDLVAAIVTILKQHKAKTVVDLGCGLGIYCQVFKLAGLSPTGYDGNPHTHGLTDGRCNVLDLSADIEIGTFDWVISLEVGEHVPQEYEETFLNNIAKSAKQGIILSWAVPGQEGLGHVNNHTNEYIIEKVEALGFTYVEKASKSLRRKAELSWFKNTLLVFLRNK